jgi:hypothetical protein
MNSRDRKLAQQLETGLLFFDQKRRRLVGIRDAATREVLTRQLVDSIHRVKYVSVIRTRKLSDRRMDPNDNMFDPLLAAILHQRAGRTEEAFWMVFLFTHFGRHARAGWRYAQEVYGRLGDGGRWDWANTSANPEGFREWLHRHKADLQREGVPRGFGNHRKYESLDARSPTGTGAVVESYVGWVGPPRTHQGLMDEACQQANGDAGQAFNHLYRSMAVVARFGRTARFDYLAMVGKLGLAPIEPGSTYMQNSTGPIKGARLLFGGDKNASLSPADLDRWLVELNSQLDVGMQVLEDALCNWQKSPRVFERFRA